LFWDSCHQHGCISLLCSEAAGRQNTPEVARKHVVFSEKMFGLFSLGTKAASLHPGAASGKARDGASVTSLSGTSQEEGREA